MAWNQRPVALQVTKQVQKNSFVSYILSMFDDIKRFLSYSKNYSSLPTRRVARTKCGGGKDEPFLISVVLVISVVVRIFTPVTVIKKRTKWINVSNLKPKAKKWYKRIKPCLWHKTAAVCLLFVFDSLSNTFACISQSFAWFLHVPQ